MIEKRFQRHIEDFSCEHCGFLVRGNGYTNHCPKCLWSKHVDVHPGDRAAGCGGMMRPEKVENERGEYILVHRCETCGHTKRNKVQTEDDFDEVVKIATPKR
jgi:rubrerythrin